MRAIHTARLDKVRPVVVLTREALVPYRTKLTVAPITSTVRGLATEVLVGPRNGLEHVSVVKVDDVTTIEAEDLGPQIGEFLEEQEPMLAAAVFHAFGLRW